MAVLFGDRPPQNIYGSLLRRLMKRRWAVMSSPIIKSLMPGYRYDRIPG